MHHYSTVTCQQAFIANHDPGIKDIYTRLAPIMALKHDSLMNGLLAAAALHIYKLDPDKTLFRDLNRKYFNAAVVDQRRAVAVINRDNADGLCLAATFLAFQALAVPQDSPNYTVPSLWLDLTTGHASLFRSAWTWLNDSNQILSIVKAEPNLQSFRDMCWQDYPAIFPENLEATIFPALLEFQDPTENLDAERIAAYKWALAFIGHSLNRIESGEDPSRIRRLLTAFGALSPPIYKTMVRERQARALVVLAYLFAILKAVDSVWWLRGIPEREVFGIQSILPERWQWALAWPIKKLSYYAVAAIPPREAVNSSTS